MQLKKQNVTATGVQGPQGCVCECVCVCRSGIEESIPCCSIRSAGERRASLLSLRDRQIEKGASFRDILLFSVSSSKNKNSERVSERAFLL